MEKSDPIEEIVDDDNIEYVLDYSSVEHVESNLEDECIRKFNCNCHFGVDDGPCSSLFLVQKMTELRKEGKSFDYYENHKLDFGDSTLYGWT